MRFDPPLVEGRLLRRYQRFLADVELVDGSVVTAHCPNPGSLATVVDPGCRAWLTPHPPGARKLLWTLELLAVGDTLVSVNTIRPNALVAAALTAGEVATLTGYDQLRREVKYGRSSRIDILLSAARKPDCYVEVKNVTMAANGLARFPDSVTARGAKHLEELTQVVAQGLRAVMLFLVARGDCQQLAPADDIDPHYGRTLRQAAAAGVELLALRTEFSPQQGAIREPIGVLL